MTLDHVVRVGGTDVSDWVESIRADESLSHNEPDKIDISLININNRFTGAFKTDDEIEVELINRRTGCSGAATLSFKLAKGIAQKISYNPKTVLIEGACFLADLSDFLAEDYSGKQRTISQVVNDLLDMHDRASSTRTYTRRYIDIQNDEAFDYQWPVMKAGQVSYQTAITHMAQKCGAIWYFDEEGAFYFVDPKSVKGSYNLDPYMLNPDETASAMGHVNIVRVVGTGALPPSNEYSPTETHERIFHEERNEESIAKHGELYGPLVVSPNLSSLIEVKERAKTLVEYYKVSDDVGRPKLVGWSPPLLSYVSYHVGVTTFSGCGGNKIEHGMRSTRVDGLVVRRIVEYSRRGLLVELEVATSVPEAGLSYLVIDADMVMRHIVYVADPDGSENPNLTEEETERISEAQETGTYETLAAALAAFEERYGVKVKYSYQTGQPVRIYTEVGTWLTIGPNTDRARWAYLEERYEAWIKETLREGAT